MNKDLVIAKQAELIELYQSFTKWVLRYSKEIIESPTGRDKLFEIDAREFELKSLIQLQSESEEEMYPASFIEWLKDECETQLDLSTGKYVFVNEDARETTLIMTTEEAFDYWKSNTPK